MPQRHPAPLTSALPSDADRIRRSFGIAVIAAALVYGVVGWAGFAMAQHADHIPLLWLPNAVLVGIALRTRPRDARAYVGAAFAANLVVKLALGEGAVAGLLFAAANAIEIVFMVAVLRRTSGETPEVADIRTLARFAAMSCVAPAVSGTVVALVASHGHGLDAAIWLRWLAADGLGLTIGVPLVMIAIDAWRARQRPSRAEVVEWTWLVLGTMAAITPIFAQSRYPVLFIACPIVVVAAFRSGVTGTAVTVALTSAVASLATYLGHGPITLIPGGVEVKLFALQLFLAVNFAIGLPVAAALTARNELRRRLLATHDFQGRILDNVQDIIFQTDAEGRWVYLNPAWERVTGYTVAESLGWRTTRLLHPDDIAAATVGYPALASGRIDQAVLRQRFHRKDGECRHIEVTVGRHTDANGAFTGTIGNIRDISDAVAQDRALRDSEARFRRMAEAAPVGIFRADATGAVTYVNADWCTRLGLTPEQSMGDGWMTALTDRTPYDSDPAWQGFAAPGDVKRRTVEFRGADGKGVWVETVNSAEFDEDGKVAGYIGVVIDITERRRANQMLVESERRFQALANLAPAGIFRTDAGGNCNYVNAAWLRMTGLGPDDWQDGGWATALHPDDLHRVAEGWARAVARSEDYRAEFRWLHPDGTVRWVDVIGRPELDEAGEVLGFIGVSIDITERRHAEAELSARDEQLTLLATNATDAVFRLTLDGHCIYASPSARELLRIAPELLIGVNLLDRFHPDDAVAVSASFAALARGEAEQSIIAYRSESVTEPGTYRWLEAHCGTVRDPATGAPREIIASIRDVSANKALEAELHDARARAEEAVAAKSAFLANMSHEIRTPMNGVIGFTELLLADELGDDQRRHVQLIAESGRAMMRLLNDILDMSKIESGQMRIADEAVELAQVVRDAARLMEPLARSKGVDLAVRIDRAIPRHIQGDALRLRQIVLNLIGNATKFTERGWIDLHAVATTDGDAPMLRIDVRDSGVGIAPDQLDRIFQQFAQADSSIARRFGGTGLGLPISAELARLMGGRITVESDVGAGTLFSLHLPLVAADCAEGYAGTGVADTPSMPTTTRPPRVLIAEDHDINQTLIAAMARRAGMEPRIAINGAEAVRMVEDAAAADAPFDLVLMDMQMPEVDGLEATRRLRAAGFDAARLPIVALTANAYAEDIAACLAAGMQAHLSKPVRLRDLTELVASHLSHVVAPASAAAPVRESLASRFARRRSDLIERIDAIIRTGALEGQDFDELCTMLHQFAGTAGFFGHAAQGTAAAALEHDLAAAGAAGAVPILAARWRDLDVAA